MKRGIYFKPPLPTLSSKRGLKSMLPLSHYKETCVDTYALKARNYMRKLLQQLIIKPIRIITNAPQP